MEVHLDEIREPRDHGQPEEANHPGRRRIRHHRLDPGLYFVRNHQLDLRLDFIPLTKSCTRPHDTID